MIEWVVGCLLGVLAVLGGWAALTDRKEVTRQKDLDAATAHTRAELERRKKERLIAAQKARLQSEDTRVPSGEEVNEWLSGDR